MAVSVEKITCKSYDPVIPLLGFLPEVGRRMAPKGIHTLIPGNYESISLHHRGELWLQMKFRLQIS